MNAEQIKELREQFNKWTGGLPLEGETKEEMMASIASRAWDLENELDRQRAYFEDELNKLIADD